MGEGKTPAQWDEWTAAMRTRHGNGNGHGNSLAIEAQRWGDYAPAVARWERVLGRPAPSPTEPGRDGRPRLSPAFVEWMMGLPAGWVTDPDIGLTRNQQLKALGNGVVPQQARPRAAVAVVSVDPSPCITCTSLDDCGTCLPRLAWEGRQPDPTPPPRWCRTCAEAAHLIGLGESAHQAAHALHITIRSLDRHLRRHQQTHLLNLILSEMREHA